MTSQPIQRNVTTVPILLASSTKVWILVASEPFIQLQEKLLFARKRILTCASLAGQFSSSPFDHSRIEQTTSLSCQPRCTGGPVARRPAKYSIRPWLTSLPGQEKVTTAFWISTLCDSISQICRQYSYHESRCMLMSSLRRLHRTRS